MEMNDTPPQFEHLPKAPIWEAVIDLRVRLDAAFDVARLKILQEGFRQEYPEVEEQTLIQQRFGPVGAAEPRVEVQNLGLLGYFFKSADGKNIVQFRKDGFSFNRLHPYTSWGEVFPEAWRLWKIYATGSTPLELSRISVRYINPIPFPRPRIEYAHYLTAAPSIPIGAPRHVAAFASRLVLVDPQYRRDANVVQAMEPPNDPTVLNVVLDIDAYEQDIADTSEESLIRRFEGLRNLKNQIFFGSLTPKALDLFR